MGGEIYIAGPPLATPTPANPLSHLIRMQRLYIPCAGPFGRKVALSSSCPDGGTLAEAVVIRGVTIPAGSEVLVDCDFDDVNITLAVETPVRGHTLPAGTVVRVLPARPLDLSGTTYPPDRYVLVAADGRLQKA